LTGKGPLFRSKKASKVLNDLKRRMVKYELIKEAILHSNPFNMALAFIYIKFFSAAENYKLRVFSTRVAAMEGLGV